MIRKEVADIEKNCTMTCPICGIQERLEMPEDYCMYFYICKNCGEMITPKPGDCCVFCSYGSVPCPSIQGAQEK
ncbi:MAG: GDCCVxC domain-containing (seleno)protein [Candidatus Izemoplasmataceae bacterium]|jgi:hypothetical protein